MKKSPLVPLLIKGENEQQVTVKGITVAMDFLGCKLNQAEIQELGRELAAAGYCIVGADEAADIYVLNTCTVTHVADRKSRQLLRQARRRNPAARLVVLGCGAQRDASGYSGIEGVELVLNNECKHDLAALLGTAGEPRTVVLDRTRAFLRIQEGCSNNCAYCIVPKVRSRVSCVPADTVIRQVQELEKEGFREIVLTGTEIGTYRDDKCTLHKLLEQILAETGIERLRVSSLQPPELCEELIGLWKNPRLCPHFHLSLQSGSDAILRLMRRRYSMAQYREAVAMIRSLVPEAAITTDIIVGFPGEMDAEFKESYAACQELGFARIHVFPYSVRPGTEAAEMKPQVPEMVKKERSRLMMELGKRTAMAFAAQCFGHTHDVLFEQGRGTTWQGHAGNYLKVYVKSYRDLSNIILPVRLEKHYRDGAWGEAAAEGG